MTQEASAEDARLVQLRAAGQGWTDEQEQSREAPVGVSADLLMVKEVHGSLPGDRYVRVVRTGRGSFRHGQAGGVQATATLPRARGPLGRLLYAAKLRLVGDPLTNEQAGHERLTKVKALAVLSSDAVSSVAYATGAMLSVLLVAGTGSFNVSVYIGAAIAALFAIVVLSYRQTVKAYPRGGGSYIVASDNLGHVFGLLAGSSLMIDYVLTVAVSITQGVANLVSIDPGLASFQLLFDITALIVLLLGNLRGIRESGTIFMLPSYMFISFVYLMIIVGTAHFLANGMHAMPPHYLTGVSPVRATESLGLFLILRAFAGGCTALTGVEAISDGVPAFKPPEWRNARTTLTALGLVAISMFAGITLLSHAYGLVPNMGDNPPTLIAQLNSSTLGGTPLFYYGQIVTALILLLAANTAYSDFPRLAFFMARDSFLPHQFTHRGDRLSYSNGILILTGLAAVLVLRYWSDASQLFNLYVIGVFASFTLSQSGMVRRWWRRREPGWRKGMAINGTGAVVTFVVLCITGYTKFLAGAWMVVVLVPIMVIGFLSIRGHYMEAIVAIEPKPVTAPTRLRHTVLVSAFHGGAYQLSRVRSYLRTMTPERVVLVGAPGWPEDEEFEGDEEFDLSRAPAEGKGEYAALVAAIHEARQRYADEVISVILPVLPRSPLAMFSQWLLRRRLLRRHCVAIVQISEHLDTALVRAHHTNLISVSSLSQASIEAMAYCRSLLRGRLLALHVVAEEDLERARHEWDAWGNHVPLVTIDSPYRAIVAPLRAYVEAMGEREGGELITMALPLVMARGLLGRFLHNHTANYLRRLLLDQPNTVVISVPHEIP
jgi:amino acid transporter